MAADFTRIYPTEVESEALLIGDLSAFLAQHRIDAEIGRHLTLCASEAFTNAMIHGNKWDKTKSVWVHLSVNEAEVCADITDQGTGGLASIARRPRPGLLAESGRGVDFIYRYCAGVELAEVEGGGLRVSLRVPRSRTKQVVK
jgi:anti-sigma regulatory factor (Ser/Thr protein kinase)